MIYGDSPISVSMSGGSGDPLWSSDTGTFANRFSSSTTFSPKNNTAESKIYGNTVARVNSGATGVSGLSSGRGYSKTSGTTWSASANSSGTLTTGTNNGFVEFESNENTTEKAAGLTISAAYKDPTVVHSTNSFIVAWHLYANGMAVPRKQGVALAAPMPYSAADIFRIEVVGLVATFKLRGRIVTFVSLPDATALIGMASFKTAGATIENISFLSDDAETPAKVGYTLVDVTGVFPVQPNYTLDMTRDINTVFSYAPDGSFTSRTFGTIKKVLNLQFVQRPFDEYEAISDFWDWHKKHIRFLYVDIAHNDSYYAVHDGGLKDQVVGPDQITMNLVIRQV